MIVAGDGVKLMIRTCGRSTVTTRFSLTSLFLFLAVNLYVVV